MLDWIYSKNVSVDKFADAAAPPTTATHALRHHSSISSRQTSILRHITASTEAPFHACSPLPRPLPEALAQADHEKTRNRITQTQRFSLKRAHYFCPNILSTCDDGFASDPRLYGMVGQPRCVGSRITLAHRQSTHTFRTDRGSAGCGRHRSQPRSLSIPPPDLAIPSPPPIGPPLFCNHIATSSLPLCGPIAGPRCLDVAKQRTKNAKECCAAVRVGL